MHLRDGTVEDGTIYELKLSDYPPSTVAILPECTN